MDVKRVVYETLEGAPAGPLARGVNFFITTLIVINIAALIVETMPQFMAKYPNMTNVFRTMEVGSVAVFTVEYILRVWACTRSSKYSGPVTGRAMFMASPLALIDLIAILPFFIGIAGFTGLDLRVLRAFRLLARSTRLGSRFEALRAIVRVITSKRGELITVIAAMLVLMLIASSVMYYIENPVQPELFSSIPATMWWGIITLTTIGYGDMYPITAVGKIMSGVFALLGIGLFALPAGVLAAGFMEEMENEKDVCTNCRKNRHPNYKH